MKNAEKFPYDETTELSMLIKNMDKKEQKLLIDHIRVKKARAFLKGRLLELLIKTETCGDEQLKQKLKINAAAFSRLKKDIITDVVGFLSERGTPLASKILMLQTCVKRNSPHIASKILREIKNDPQLDYFPQLHLEFLKTEYDYLWLAGDRKTGDELLARENRINNAVKAVHDYEILSNRLRKLIYLRTISNLRVTNEEVEDVWQEFQFVRHFEYDTSNIIIHLLHQTALAMAGYLTNEEETTLAATDAFISIWIEKQDLIALYPELFFEGIKICFYIYFLWRMPADASSLAMQLNSIAERRLSENDRRKWKIIMFHTRLKVFNKTARFKGVQKLLEKESKQIIEYSSKYYSLKDHLSIVTSVCLTEFILGNYKKADELMYEIKELNKKAQAEDILYFTSVFHLMILYEMRDWYRFQLMLDAAYRQLYKLKKKRDFEKELMLFLKKLSNLSTVPRYRDYAEEFMEKLEKYRQDPVTKLYFLYFNYYGWLSAKLGGIDYKFYVARNLGLSEPA